MTSSIICDNMMVLDDVCLCSVCAAIPKPTRAVELETFVVLEGRTLTLYCNLTSSPPPRFTWWMNGKPLLPKEGVTFSEDQQELILSPASYNQHGEYNCSGSNQHITPGEGGIASLPPITVSVYGKYANRRKCISASHKLDTPKTPLILINCSISHRSRLTDLTQFLD